MKRSPDTSGVAELALTVAAALLLPTLIGIAADQRFDTAPWALLAGALAGVTFATYGLVRLMRKRYESLAPPSERRDD